MNPREVEDLSRFFIGEHNLNHIRFMDNSGKKRLEDILNKIVKGKHEKWTINYKKTQFMVVCKRDSTRHILGASGEEI